MADAQDLVRAQVLIVDDEKDHAETMAEALHKPGHVCTIVNSKKAAEEELRHGNFDVVVTDLVMETPRSGMEVLELVRQVQPDAATIMVTAHGDIPTAKEALRGGAYDFIVKPLDLVVFRNLVQRAAESVLLRHQNEKLRGQVDAAYGFEGIIGEALARLAKVDPVVAEQVSDFRRIVAFRNILVHGYATVDDRIVWGVVEASLPGLMQSVDALLASA